MPCFLFRVTPGDPMTPAGVADLLAMVALAATLVPAWRAVRTAVGRVLTQE